MKCSAVRKVFASCLGKQNGRLWSYSHFVLLEMLNWVASGENRRSSRVWRAAPALVMSPQLHPSPSSYLHRTTHAKANAFQRAKQLIKTRRFKPETAALTLLLLFRSPKPWSGPAPPPGAAPVSQQGRGLWWSPRILPGLGLGQGTWGCR